MKILFLHGLESGPHGSKYQALTWMFGDILAPDCTGISDEHQRLKIIQQALAAEKEPVLVIQFLIRKRAIFCKVKGIQVLRLRRSTLRRTSKTAD